MTCYWRITFTLLKLEMHFNLDEVPQVREEYWTNTIAPWKETVSMTYKLYCVSPYDRNKVSGQDIDVQTRFWHINQLEEVSRATVYVYNLCTLTFNHNSLFTYDVHHVHLIWDEIERFQHRIQYCSTCENRFTWNQQTLSFWKTWHVELMRNLLMRYDRLHDSCDRVRCTSF